MKRILRIALLLAGIIPGCHQANAQQPAFSCTQGVGYLFQTTTTDIYTVNLQTGATTLQASDVLGTTNGEINGVGYNVKDNYIWGHRAGTNQLARVGSDFSVQTFAVPGLPTAPAQSLYIGDINSDGVMYLYNNNTSPGSITRVDLNPSSPTYLTLLPAVSTTPTNILDWAFSPIDGNLYALSSDNTFHLYRFNPATGARTDLGAVTGGGIQVDNPGAIFGAAYMDATGTLYVSANATGRVYSIPNPHAGAVTAALMGIGPASSSNDGARCPLASVLPDPPAFSCSNAGEGYLFQDAATDVYVVNISTGATNLVATDILGTTGNTQINAIGYNRTDNYIWGFRRGSNEIARVGSDWSVQTFPITGIPADGDFYIGDVDAAGVLYLYNYAAYPTSIYRVNVNPASPTYLQALPTLTTTASNLTDWAFSPVDNNLYAIDNTTLDLYRYDPATGIRTTVGTVSGGGITPGGTFGAAYMDGDGALFVSENASGQIFRIASPHTGGITAQLLATGPSSTLNDGARCPAGSIQVNPSISGTVHSDPDGGDINGTGTNAGGTLNANLVGDTGSVTATQPVAADGSYSILNVAPGDYTIVLSTTQGTVGNPAPAPSVPTGYVNTNEGLTPNGDGTVNGTIPVTVATADITSADFAIQQLPVGTPVILPNQSNPGGTNTIDITTHFTGSDPDGNVAQLRFRAFPAQITTFVIDGTPYNAGNFPPPPGVTVPYGSPVLIDPTDDAGTVVVPFSLLDNAGHESPTENVTVPFLALPVTLVRFDATIAEQSVLLSWSTTEETNSDRFEIQHSIDGRNWNLIGVLNSAGESNVLRQYQYKHDKPVRGDNLYRLKMIDRAADGLDATFAYSRIVNVKVGAGMKTIVFPNPAADKVTLLVEDSGSIDRIEVIGVNGQLFRDNRKVGASILDVEVDTKNLRSGTYIMRITRSDGSVDSIQFIKQ